MILKTNRALWTAKLTDQKIPSAKTIFKASKRPSKGTILGIDPSLKGTGLALIEFQENSLPQLIYHNTLKLKGSIEACLGELLKKTEELIETYPIDEAAMESVIYVQNNKTAQSLGAVSGVLMAVLNKAGIQIETYAPKRIKKALTGYGNAPKEQIALTLKERLNLSEPLTFDESDAAAVALCHLERTLSYQ